MQIVGGGVIGFFAGVWLGRKQIQYQYHVGAVVELRHRLREARESFANMSTPPEFRLAAGQLEQFPEGVVLEQFPEEVEEAGKKLDALASYLADNGNWLDKETYERLDDLTDKMAFLWADVHSSLNTFVSGADDAGEDVIRSLRAAWEWLDETAEEIEEINERFNRAVGTHTPWWRKILGGP